MYLTRAIKPTGSWSLCGSVISPRIVDICHHINEVSFQVKCNSSTCRALQQHRRGQGSSPIQAWIYLSSFVAKLRRSLTLKIKLVKGGVWHFCREDWLGFCQQVIEFLVKVVFFHVVFLRFSFRISILRRSHFWPKSWTSLYFSLCIGTFSFNVVTYTSSPSRDVLNFQKLGPLNCLKHLEWSDSGAQKISLFFVNLVNSLETIKMI